MTRKRNNQKLVLIVKISYIPTASKVNGKVIAEGQVNDGAPLLNCFAGIRLFGLTRPVRSRNDAKN